MYQKIKLKIIKLLEVYVEESICELGLGNIDYISHQTCLCPGLLLALGQQPRGPQNKEGICSFVGKTQRIPGQEAFLLEKLNGHYGS